MYMRVRTNISILEFKGLSEIFFYHSCQIHIRGIELFSYCKGKWIFCKTKIICVTGIGQSFGAITLLIWVFNSSRQSGFEQYCS